MPEARPSIETSDKLFVNEATLEYFKLQIESQVRERIFKWIGIPLGGGGLLAIVFAVWIWIPDKVAQFIDSSEVVSEQIGANVIDYLNDPEGGGRIVTSAVEKQFQSPEIRQVVERAVNEALKPASANLASHIRANQRRLVAELSPVAVTGISKEGMGKLHDFLQSEEAAELRQSRKPLALTLTASGPIRYAAFAIGEYVERLRAELNLERVLIFDPDGKFVAAIRPEPFLAGLDDELVGLLNANDYRDSRDALAALIESRFGRHALSSLANTLTLREALIEGPWENWRQMSETVAVVEDGEFVGLTGRDRMIAMLLESRP